MQPYLSREQFMDDLYPQNILSFRSQPASLTECEIVTNLRLGVAIAMYVFMGFVPVETPRGGG